VFEPLKFYVQHKNNFSKLSLSGVTVARRIEELGTDIESTLKEPISKFIYLFILFLFIRGIDSNFNITEELAAPFPIKGTTKSCDIFNALIKKMLIYICFNNNNNL